MGCCAIKGEIDPNAPEWMDKKWSREKLEKQWSSLKAGDILLVTYREGSPNRLIGNSQRSFWDHIGIVVHGFDRSSWQCAPHDEPAAVDCMDARDAGPQLFEASASGAHIYNLFDRVTDPEGYKSHRICYSLRRLVGVHRNKEFYEVVEKLCRDTLGAKYPALISLLGSALRTHHSNELYRDPSKAESDETKEIHCSQLCALLYQRLGLLSTQYSSKNFQPADFSSESSGQYKVDFLMAKLSDATLTEEELFFYEGQHEEHEVSNQVVPSNIETQLSIRTQSTLDQIKADFDQNNSDFEKNLQAEAAHKAALLKERRAAKGQHVEHEGSNQFVSSNIKTQLTVRTQSNLDHIKADYDKNNSDFEKNLEAEAERKAALLQERREAARAKRESIS